MKKIERLAISGALVACKPRKGWFRRLFAARKKRIKQIKKGAKK